MITGSIISEDFEIIQKIGQGSFGYVYKIKHRITNEKYALKTDQKSNTKQELQMQAKVLQSIHSTQNNNNNNQIQIKGYLNSCVRFIPCLQTCNMMIMPLFGQNLYNLFQLCQKRFDSSTIYHVANSILKNIQYLHQLGYIHRDIKLQNFVIGYSGQQTQSEDTLLEDDNIYLIDFGLAKAYLETKDNLTFQHIEYEIGKKARGTPMYISINVMLGIEPSRRDDLQSFMYVIIYLMKGRLPWKNFKFDRKDYNELLKVKLLTKNEELFMDLPKELEEIYIYVRNLQFQQKPDYQKMFKALESILQYKRTNIEEKYNGEYRKYCWQLHAQKLRKSKQKQLSPTVYQHK